MTALENLPESTDLDPAQRRIEELQTKVENLERALDTRDTIGMAKGIVMANEQVSAEEAFDRLRVASQHDPEQRRLAVIADEVVHTGELPEADGA